MDVRISREGGRTVIAVDGRVDTGTSPKLDMRARKLYEQGDADLVVDLAACDYVSSAGLRVIASMVKRAAKSGSLAFRNVQPPVMEVLKATGFDSVLSFE